MQYIRIEVSEEEFPAAVEIARRKLIGFNCTHPFKHQILSLLDYADDRVRTLNACNTVHVLDGKLYGYNTDGAGITTALALSNVTLKNANVLLLGCGGAASAFVYEAALAGSKITIAARNLNKAEAFAKTFKNLCYDLVQIDDVSGTYDLVVNATPVGMTPNTGVAPIDLSKVNVSFVYDMIYSPAMTRLLLDADSRGIPLDNGLSMLIFQGAASQQYWFGHSFTKEEQCDVLDAVSINQARKRLGGRNLILSGFMCAGKSTIGRILAEALNLKFIDTDDALVKEFGCSITEFFDAHGEAAFREREANLAHRLSQESGYVIALGGGTIINPKTAAALHENGLVLFLNTPFEELKRRFANDTTRPLLKQSNVEKLYQERLPVYLDTADAVVRIPEGARALPYLLRFI